MTYSYKISRLLLFMILFASLPLAGAVKTKDRAKFEMPGFLGGLMKTFGGKAAKEGIVTETWVLGDRMMTRTDSDRGQLIDLEAEQIHEIEFNKKRYKTVTFDQYRENLKKAQEQMAQVGGGSSQSESRPSKEMEVEVDIKNTGQSQVKNGFNCQLTILTVTMREKGKTLEEGGGMRLTNLMWLSKDVPPTDEVSDFHRRFAEKLGLFSTDIQAGALASLYPAFQKLTEKIEDQKGEIEGSAVVTEMTTDLFPDPHSPQAQQGQAEKPSLKGMLGGLGGFGRRSKKEEPPPQAAQGQPGSRALFKGVTEMLEVSSAVQPGDVAIPATFKQRQ
ncbi:MAG: hypothetical protein O2968_01685 [Acidobacteria bacterium]|nr:hypothetical protein [Acidobacteriota bacterium]